MKREADVKIQAQFFFHSFNCTRQGPITTKNQLYLEQISELTNKEASTVLCSVVKHAGSGRARKKCRGKHET